MKVNMSQENRNNAFLSRFPGISAFPHILILADTGTLIRSQSTGELENGRSYSEPLFKKFFEQFAPKPANKRVHYFIARIVIVIISMTAPVPYFSNTCPSVQDCPSRQV